SARKRRSLTGVDARTSASVTAIVVMWNARALIDDCLTAIFSSAAHVGELEVIVVDNASRDGSADLVRQRWPHVRLIENTDNVGYTRANNQAIRASSGKYLLLVNADGFLREARDASMAPRGARRDRSHGRALLRLHGRRRPLPARARCRVERLVPARRGMRASHGSEHTAGAGKHLKGCVAELQSVLRPAARVRPRSRT